MTESLFATQARLYAESSIGNGTPTGNIVDLPSFSAAASRQTFRWEDRADAFRTKRAERQPIHVAYRLRTSHQVDTGLAAWIMTAHCFDRGSGQWDIRRLGMPEPSFTLQFETEDGDVQEFRGCHIDEIQISAPEGRAITLEISWHAMSRVTGTTLQTATQTFTTPEAVSTVESAATFITGSLTNRATDAIPVHSAEFVMSRDLELLQFGPDGQPDRARQAPWRCIAELVLPAGATTEAALSGQTGAYGFWVGPASGELALTSDNVKAYRDTEPLKSPELRDHSLTIEFRPDTTGRILNIAATV